MTAMSPLLDLAAVNLLDARSLLAAFGVLGILVVLFAETGLLVGFFLPGDSLLFTAGLLSSAAVAQPLPLPLVLLAAVTGALLGAQVGYLIGRRAGPALTDRSRRPKVAQAMTRSQHLLERYGFGRAIVLARFVPVVRTVLNPVAGALGVPAPVFALWQVVGGLLWTVGLVLAGFLLGRYVPGVDQYLLPVIALVVVVSLIPLAVEVLRARRDRRGGTSGGPPTDVLPAAGGSARLDTPTERLTVPSTVTRAVPPRVMVIDHDPRRRAWWADGVRQAPDLELVGTVPGSGLTRALLDTLGSARPDVVLVAVDDPEGDGVGTIATIRASHPRVRTWTYAADRTHPAVVKALAAGATGSLTERAPLDELRTALHAVKGEEPRRRR